MIIFMCITLAFHSGIEKIINFVVVSVLLEEYTANCGRSNLMLVINICEIYDSCNVTYTRHVYIVIVFPAS